MRKLTPRLEQAIKTHEREIESLRKMGYKGTAKILEEEFSAAVTEFQLSDAQENKPSEKTT